MTLFALHNYYLIAKNE